MGVYQRLRSGVTVSIFEFPSRTQTNWSPWGSGTSPPRGSRNGVLSLSMLFCCSCWVMPSLLALFSRGRLAKSVRKVNPNHLSVGNVNLSCWPGDKNHLKRAVIIATFASYIKHSLDAQFGLVCWQVQMSTPGSVRGRPSCSKEQNLSKIWS